MQFLIVEDEWLIADTIEQTLIQAGHSIAGICGSLELAYEMLATQNFHAVILDANLRGQSSVPIADALLGKKIPFIVTSGYASGQRTGSLAAAPFLRKPFKPAELALMLDEVCKKVGLDEHSSKGELSPRDKG